MTEGLCKLCNQVGQLSYEHVPPKVTFNKKTRFRSVNFLEYVNEPNPLETKYKGKIEQGGIGYYSLCRNCNSFLGTTYVRDFQKYTNSFVEFAKKKDLNAFELTMHNFRALYVIKQIVSMFFAINDETFSKNNRDLAAFVLDSKSNILPKRFRLFNYINTEGQLRYLSFMLQGSLTSNNYVLGSEIAFPPLGYVMTVDFNGKLPYHQEITSFVKSEGADEISFDFKIYRLPTYLPFLLDYRDRDTIQKAIVENS